MREKRDVEKRREKRERRGLRLRGISREDGDGRYKERAGRSGGKEGERLREDDEEV